MDLCTISMILILCGDERNVSLGFLFSLHHSDPYFLNAEVSKVTHLSTPLPFLSAYSFTWN